MLEAMQRLEARQQELLELLQQVALRLPETVTPQEAERYHREQTELLMELLQAQQLAPAAEIAQRLGLLTPPSTSPSSAD